MIYKHPSLLKELVEALPSIDRVDDDGDEDDDTEEPDSEAPVVRESISQKDLETKAAERLLVALRHRARSLALGRSTLGGRVGRVMTLIGDRFPSSNELSPFGTRILTRNSLRTFMQAPRLFRVNVRPSRVCTISTECHQARSLLSF